MLAGEGRLRSDDGEEREPRPTGGARTDRAASGESREERLTAGDYVALPAGPEGAHRVVNDGDEPLRYLAVSTMRDADVSYWEGEE